MTIWLVLALLASAGPADVDPEPVPDLVRWRSVADGLAESRITHCPVLYFFTADWCAPCLALKRVVIADPDVADLIDRNFVPVEVNDIRDANDESLPEVEQLKFRFLVSRLPTLVVTRPDGGPAVSEEGAAVYSRMVEFLKTAPGRLEQLEEQYRKRRDAGR